MILADLNYQSTESLFYTMLGINYNRFDHKAVVLQVLSGFLIYGFVFRIDFLPVQVLFKPWATSYNNPISSPEETAIHADYNRLGIRVI